MDALSALSPKGYEGRQMRGKMKDMLPFNMVDSIMKGEPLDWGKVPIGFVPGFYQYKTIREALMTYQDDPLHAIGALMTMPMKPETPSMVADLWEARPRRPETIQTPGSSWQQVYDSTRG